VLSATVMMVPSMAQTSSPRQRTPAVPPGTAAGPRSRSNSVRSGAAPSRRRAWVSAAAVGRRRQPVQPGRQPVPDLHIAKLGEQAPGQQQADHDPGRQVPDPGLHPARLGQHRIDHLERHLLGQLTQMTRREPPWCHPDHARNDRLIQQRGSRE
jgi:hypothetical protein